jgi:hypothetical protein
MATAADENARLWFGLQLEVGLDAGGQLDCEKR